MPELPEVEVTRRQVAPLLVGRTVASAVTSAPSHLFLTPPEELSARLPGRRTEALERRGKYLLARLDDRSRLVIHLGMTGQLFGEGATSVRLLASTARAALHRRPCRASRRTGTPTCDCTSPTADPASSSGTSASSGSSCCWRPVRPTPAWSGSGRTPCPPSPPSSSGGSGAAGWQ